MGAPVSSTQSSVSSTRRHHCFARETVPRSQSAAESQFKVGEMYQVIGKDKKAFEAFQKLLTDYKGSPRFAEATCHRIRG